MVVTGRPASADALRRQRPSNSNPQSPRDVGHELLRRHSGRLESPTIQAAQRNALFFQQVSRRPTIDDALPSSPPRVLRMPPAPSRQSPAKSPLAPTVTGAWAAAPRTLMEAVAAAPSAAPPPPRPPPPVRTEPPPPNDRAQPPHQQSRPLIKSPSGLSLGRMSPPPLHTEPTSDDFPPKTGIRMPLLFEPPGLAPHDDDQPVPLAPPRDESYEEALLQARLDEEAVADTAVRRVVFDSETSPLPPPPPGSAAERWAEEGWEPDAAAGGPPPLAGGPFPNTLRFESRFESGNLRRATQVGAHAYELVLRADVSTESHTRWFHFEFEGAQKGVTYTFSIVNFSMGDCLYSSGLRPLLWSSAAHAAHGTGWRRCGDDLLYYPNGRRRRAGRRSTYHTLRFSLRPQFDGDRCRLAGCVPYTLTQIRHHISLLCDPPPQDTFRARHCIRRRRLCSTLAGNACDVLTISEFAPPGADADEAAAKMAARKAIVLSARVHPGETGASWMMQGVLDFLTSQAPEARLLRSRFVFKIVPCLNPDGVVVGNHRCNLAGVDLNRRWGEPSKALHPTIYATKTLMHALRQDRELFLYCDFHTHSKRKSVFAYGTASDLSHERRLAERVLPFLLARNSGGSFSYEGCTFKLRPGKEGTARAVCARQVGVPLAYTVEASYAGPKEGPWRDHHFTTRMLCEQGKALCLSLLQLCDPMVRADTLADLTARHPPRIDGASSSSEAGSGSSDDEPAPTKRGGGAGARRRASKAAERARAEKERDYDRPWMVRPQQTKAAHPPRRGGGGGGGALPAAERQKARALLLRAPSAGRPLWGEQYHSPSAHRPDIADLSNGVRRPSLSTAATAATAASRWSATAARRKSAGL